MAQEGGAHPRNKDQLRTVDEPCQFAAQGAGRSAKIHLEQLAQEEGDGPSEDHEAGDAQTVVMGAAAAVPLLDGRVVCQKRTQGIRTQYALRD